jgi:hypothetical protein
MHNDCAGKRMRELLAAFEAYRPARQAFLRVLGLPSSNRDPLSELSDQLVCSLVGGTMATAECRLAMTWSWLTAASCRCATSPTPQPCGSTSIAFTPSGTRVPEAGRGRSATALSLRWCRPRHNQPELSLRSVVVVPSRWRVRVVVVL